MKSTFKQTFKHLNILHSIYCSLFKTIGIMATPKAPQEQGSNDSVSREKRPLSDADDEEHIAKKSRDILNTPFYQLCWQQEIMCFSRKRTTGKLEIGSYWWDDRNEDHDLEGSNISAIRFKKCILQLMFCEEEELFFKNIFTNKVKRFLVHKLDDCKKLIHIPVKYYRFMEIEAKNAEKEMTEFRANATMEPVYLFSKQNVCLLQGDIICVDGRLGWIDQAKVCLTYKETYWHAELDILLLSNDGKERTKHLRVRTRPKVLSTKFVNRFFDNDSSITIEFVRRAGTVMKGPSYTHSHYSHYFLPVWGKKHKEYMLRGIPLHSKLIYKGEYAIVKKILCPSMKKDGIIIVDTFGDEYFTDVCELTEYIESPRRFRLKNRA